MIFLLFIVKYELDFILEWINAKFWNNLLKVLPLLLYAVFELSSESMRLLRGLPELADDLICLFRLWCEEL